MRGFLALGAVLLVGSLTLAGEVDDVVAELQQAYPGVLISAAGAQVDRVYGAPCSYGVSAEQSADNFVHTFAGVFGVTAEELLPGNAFNHQYAQPVMYQAETGTYKFTLVYYHQYRDGVPVYRADLRLLVRNEAAFPLVLVASSLRALGDFSVARAATGDIAEGAAHAAAVAFEPGLVNFGPAELVIWAGVDERPASPTLAITFVGDGLTPDGLYRKWRFVTDAATGAVLHTEDLILFTDVAGSVQGLATEGSKADICNDEVAMPMPWGRVAISGGNAVYADGAGNFTIPNSGSSTVSVLSYMYGLYFNVDNYAGAEETLTLSVTPPGPANFLHNAANASEAVRAQVNAYVQANKVRDWVLAQNPGFPTISAETNFPIHVNRTDLYCPGNAWSDGSSINFCSSGQGYVNTAFQSVIHHEYGHHVVDCGGSGQDAYGEGMSDCHSMLTVDDPVLGYGFAGNCNAGIRTGDNDFQYPCTGEIHECGQLLSGCVWSTRNELYITEPVDYLSIISNLTVNSILLHQGGAITPQICVDFLTLDDDDSDLTNGTPHFTEITTGFGAHNMWQGLPPENDDCAEAARACPGAYSYTTTGRTVDGSASCGSSNSTPDAWYRYTPQTSGSLTLELCDSSYDTVLSVHSGCPGTSANQLACNDDTSWFGACGFLPTSQSALTLNVIANTTYYIRISGKNGATGTYVLNVSGPACAAEDTTSPSPDPMTFASAPAAISANTIKMTAMTATDAGSPPVQYEFEFVAGGAGGASSGWQASTLYANEGLVPDTTYTYRVRARDSASPPNMTGYSGSAAATTWANVPAAPALANATASTLELDVQPNGNPAYTVFAIRCAATNPADAAWDGMYVGAGGQPSATPVWQTDAQWATLTVAGLQAATEYTFVVKARNQAGVETAWGPTATLTTGTNMLRGDLNCDGEVGFRDINAFVLRLANPEQYAAAYPTCPDANGDINEDGSVSFGDINPFVALLAAR